MAGSDVFCAISIGESAPLQNQSGGGSISMTDNSGNSSRTEHLSNGLTAVVVEVPHAHQVLVSLLVRVGSRYEAPGEAGISHFLEHMLFRGNEAFPDSDALNRAFESVGGMLGAHTGVEATGFEFTAHPTRLAEGLEHLSRFLRNPTFADLEKERRILLDELAYDYNEQGLLVHLPALTSEMLWPEHPLGRLVGGLPSTVSSLDAPRLRAHFHRYYRPRNMVLAMGGKVSPEEGLRLARRFFQAWEGDQDRTASSPSAPSPSASPPPEPPAPPVAAPPPHQKGIGPHLKLVPDADNQFHLQLSFPAPGYNDPDEIPMTLLGRILDDGPTSRLQRILREEKALVYHLAGSHSGYWDAGSYDLATSVKAEGLDPLLRHLMTELAAFRDGGATPDELERARMRHLYELDFSRDSLSAILDRHAWPLLHSQYRSEEEERREVEAVTLEQIHQLTRKLLLPDTLHMALVGPLGKDTEKQVRTALEHF